MQTFGQRLSRRAGVIVLVALLFVPGLLRGHRHADHASPSRSCAVCLVAKHSPAASAPPLTGVTPVFTTVAARALPVIFAARDDRPAASGRAPPLPGSAHLA